MGDGLNLGETRSPLQRFRYPGTARDAPRQIATCTCCAGAFLLSSDLTSHENLRILPVEAKASIAGHVGDGRKPAPLPKQALEIVAVVPGDERPVLVHGIAVVDGLVNVHDPASIHHRAAIAFLNMLVFWRRENMGAPGFEHPHDLPLGKVWPEYMLKHVLGDKQVKLLVSESKLFKVFASPALGIRGARLHVLEIIGT